jgi:hypothetical protein
VNRSSVDAADPAPPPAAARGRAEVLTEEERAMVVHVVLTKLKPTATPEQVDRAMAALNALPGRVPGLLEMKCGVNFSPARAQGYGFGLVARFEGRPELAAYGPHPEHQAASALLREVSDDLLALDFEV